MRIFECSRHLPEVHHTARGTQVDVPCFIIPSSVLIIQIVVSNIEGQIAKVYPETCTVEPSVTGWDKRIEGLTGDRGFIPYDSGPEVKVFVEGVLAAKAKGPCVVPVLGRLHGTATIQLDREFPVAAPFGPLRIGLQGER